MTSWCLNSCVWMSFLLSWQRVFSVCFYCVFSLFCFALALLQLNSLESSPAGRKLGRFSSSSSPMDQSPYSSQIKRKIVRILCFVVFF